MSQLLGHWPYRRVLAHRGGGSFAPENTLAAMKTGKAMGFASVEFDVQLSSDSIPALMHDATLERTTNGRGRLADFSMAELSQLDAGGWHSPAFRGEPVPRLEEVARYLQSQNMTANVEIKPPKGAEHENGYVIAAACALLWQGSVVPPLLSSFSADGLRAALLAAPNLPRALLVEKPEKSHLSVLKELDAVSLNCNHTHVNAEVVAWVHSLGLRILCYTVNDPQRAAALFAMGVDGLFTDNLAEMARFVGKSAGEPPPGAR